MGRWIILGIVAAVLTGCGGSAASAPPAPTAAAIGQGTIVGYDEATTGLHVADIELHSQPADASVPNRTVGAAHEGEQVDILEIHGDTLLVRTPSGTVGWTQINFVSHR